MQSELFSWMRTRRRLLQGFALGAAARGAFAETLSLQPTPRLTEGPYYPDKMPLDTDNDLLIINDAITPAVGEITHLTGKVLTSTGQPLRNAFIEIWQVDAYASYIHSRGHNPAKQDGNFQGYGRFLTDVQGQYYFRTIKPVPYNLQGMARAPHIHVAVSKNGHRLLTTQIMVKGYPGNKSDMVLNDAVRQGGADTILVNFQPLAGSKIGELPANFDIILGRTIQEPEDGKVAGGIGKHEGGGPGGPFGGGGPGGRRPPFGEGGGPGRGGDNGFGPPPPPPPPPGGEPLV